MRKDRVEQQKLGDAVGRHVRGVDAAVRLERGAALEQTHPFEILGRLVGDAIVGFARGLACGALVVGAEQRGDGVAALQEAPRLDELPALRVAEGRVGEALEEVDRLLDGAEELVRLPPPDRVDGRAAHGQVEAVDLLPHLGADLLAHLARVLPRGQDAGDHRGGVALVEGQMAGDFVRVDPVRGRRGLEALQHAHPVLAARLGRSLQVERQVDVDQPRGVLGALQVAAHPIEVIGDARKHTSSYGCPDIFPDSRL